MECERLWCQYSKTVQQQTDLLTQYSDAVKARELGKVQELEGALAIADTLRNSGRETLMGHRLTCRRKVSHDDFPAAANGAL